MSTTVNYKGDTIATLSNETKTLTTAGSWLEDDIEITDNTPSIVITDTEDSAGGTIREITSVNSWKMQSQKMVTPTSSVQTILPDTGYDGFTSVVVEASQSGGSVMQDSNGYIVLPSVGGGSGNGNGNNATYTRYTLTEDTTIKSFIDSINYEVPDAFEHLVIIRSSGSGVPSSGSWTINNFIFVFINGVRVYGRHYYKSGHASADSFPDLPQTNENDSAVDITNGVFTSSSTSTSPIGTTGTVVTLFVSSTDYDNAKMNGGAL